MKNDCRIYMISIVFVHFYAGDNSIDFFYPIYLAQRLSVMPNMNPFGTSVIG